MEQLKRRLSRAFWFTLALVFLFESWLWDNVKEWLRALGRAVGAERIEPWLEALVARLSPPATLLLFAAPTAIVLPVKMLAVALMAHGKVVTGLALVFFAKVLTLGVVSFLFDICRDRLLEMRWFGRVYSLVLDARAWATMLVRPYKARLSEVAGRIKSYAKSVLGKEGGDFARRIARLRELARPKRSA